MDQGNTAFMLICAALVLLMTPGLAFFYGGLVKAKSVISMMMLSFGAMGLIGVLWVLFGYAIAFGNPTSIPGGSESFVGIQGLIGLDVANLGLGAAFEDSLDPTGAYPTIAFAAFQATFAIITVALISGAIADRAKFGAWMIFAGVWATVVYFPVASWVFNFTKDADGNTVGGWIAAMGVIDFAGGTAVHINAGAAALALALVLGKRVGFAKGADKPHNPPFVLLGAGLLWFGWFGFNAGSELAADGVAALAFLNTIAAPAAAVLGWLVVEKLKDGKATSVGAASGAVAGLVAITPACAALTPGWAVVLGVVAGAVCALAIDLKFKLGFDDSLDVVGIHLVGGLIGTLYLGIFANDTGLIFSGTFTQLGIQALSALAVMLYSFVLAFVIGFVIEKTIGFRVKNEDEVAGIDLALHGEEGYVLENSRA
ncbi:MULTISPECIES: ammonium transporter [unclassified Frigoribacterium]|uniref:ammonium transporter n=1 Tax=unclassified Frigoribacterium TaxID=2627005 RepID=UPI000F464A90|nr:MULTISPECIES: ammonium transporter [unclassified Frigoribacterium]MBD8485568.1 ammonium transporter [Frigoribacterium sp. CFBP 8759]NQW86031.1 ammonium transporter [Frigoribacterium sp. VKM Ac-2860]NQX07363.1 ammonium transporter [Frigoribacterium sp. VKM Ac-2859]ROS56750.1 ammonium transporter [Frigoribacterium sp. PhB118]VXB34743.1 putative ammonia channel [Frigoribacterium sp. 9N]